MPKPVPNLCMSCVQAWALLVHWSYCLDTPCTLHRYCLDTPCTLYRYCLDTPCTLELLLEYSLYTTQVLLEHSLYTRATAWAFLVHYTGTAWILLARIQYNDLGTLSTLQGYCFGIPGTLELHAWAFLANKLPLGCPPLVHYLKLYTCAL